MIERELAALADRVAPAARPDLPDRVLARIDDLDTGRDRNPNRVRGLVAAALAALVAASFVSPQVRAVAADLLGVAGIEFSSDPSDTPDAPPEPRAPLPDSRETSLADAQAQVDFPIGVPARLGRPDAVTVADGGRVVTMTWRGGRVLLDQFEGHLGPVFAKEVDAMEINAITVRGTDAWWIGAPHDLTYVDEDGREFTATARLAGRTLVWDGGAGVTFRLEGERLDEAEAAAIARSVR